MTIKQLIDLLKEMPQDAECFYGQCEVYRNPGSDLAVFSLYDFVPVHYKELRSCRSMLPSSNTIKKNVVVFEYD